MTLTMRKVWGTLCLMMMATCAMAQYVPSDDNLKARKEFEEFRFGIFLHWGIYSEFAQGEWYLNSGGLQHEEYQKAASCFYPVRFNAREWVKAFKDAGARYVTFTSRHHDGFSMWHTQASDYNIVDATPFKRDVLGELAEACAEEGMRLHLYYSILDWMREDYPLGRTGRKTRSAVRPDYDSYFGFMKKQMNELLGNYPQVEGIWLDGYWDHDADSVPFDWRMPEFYRYIHSLKPRCLIGNNHHVATIEGEDFQMFERDLPGENKAGFSAGQTISSLPLEMCETMNGMWGYKVADQNYKPAEKLIELLVRAAAKGSNLLLNIGPQPNGELPAAALQRLKVMGQWLRTYGESVYNTRKGRVPEGDWGVSTENDERLFLHVLNGKTQQLTVTMENKPKKVTELKTGKALEWKYDRRKKVLTIGLPEHGQEADYVVTVC